MYQESGGCSSCGQTAQSPTTVVVVPGGQQASPGTANGNPAPEVAPSEQIGPRETFRNPASENTDLQPAPANGAAPSGTTPDEKGNDSLNSDAKANYFEAPRLFNPSDRSASRVAAPVHHAVYEKPASYRNVSIGRITAAQAQHDAAGWTSASN